MLCDAAVIVMILGVFFCAAFMAASEICRAFNVSGFSIAFLAIAFLIAVAGVCFGVYHQTSCG